MNSNSRTIQSIIVLALVMIVALRLGFGLVTAQVETLFISVVAAILITGFALGKRIWLFFILFTSMDVMLYRWAGTIEIGQALFLGFSLLLFLMRKLPFQAIFGELEFWMLLIIACILQAYIRFPVGLNVFGADNVGGRPYFVLALCISTGWLLSILRVPPKEIKWAMRLSILGTFLGVPLQLARYGSLSVMSEGFSRIPSFSVLSILLAQWISSRISPLKALLKPSLAFLLLLSLALAAGSGYRNSVAAVGLIYLVALFYHGGMHSVIISTAMSTFVLIFVAIINLNFPLPGNIQRALSPFPGTWEERYVDDTDRSTDFRVEMWKEALFTDRWIHNKFIGDGIGLSAQQLQGNLAIDAARIGKVAGGLTAQQENMLVVGSFHSGPVHSIRMVGYIGLLIFVVAMIRLGVHAHRQIMRCRGTEWYPVALFFGIPVITHPIFFIFVFGEYHMGVATWMLGMGMIRLMERNIPLPAYVPARLRIPQPVSLSQRQAVREA